MLIDLTYLLALNTKSATNGSEDGVVKSRYDFIARKGIPADIRDEYFRLFGVRWEERLTLPAQTPRHEAKTRLGEWTAEIETRIETLRAAARGDGQPLTHRNAHALAGRWYKWYVAQYEDDPGRPERWHELSEQLAWNVLRPQAPEEYEVNPSADEHWDWARKPEVRAELRPLIAQEARVACASETAFKKLLRRK